MTSRHSHHRLAPVVLLVAALGLAACGGDSDAAPATTTTEETTTTTAPPPPAPLTGLPESDDAVRERPALVLKIDNHDRLARPQAGINEADVVFEEQVEGGVTRLAAVFHSEDADPVGPIRSGRTTDIAIVSQLNHPLFGFSGANSATLNAILDAPIVDVRWDARPDAYRRVSERPAPHNLFTSTEELYTSAPDDAVPPPSLFEYRADVESEDGEPVDSFSITFSGSAGYGASWDWDARSGEWEREQIGTPHVDPDGEQVSVPNVVVQVVGYATRFGNPEAQLVGEGSAYVFTRGRVIEGTWQRSSLEEVTRFLDAAGNDILLTPGQTWVELPPVGSPPAIEYSPAAGNA